MNFVSYARISHFLKLRKQVNSMQQFSDQRENKSALTGRKVHAQFIHKT